MSEQETKEIGLSELIADIKKAGASELVIEFEYPYVPGVFFQLAYASKQMLRKISDASKESFFNTRTRQQEDRTNSEKFDRTTTRELIRGWRGLSVGAIKKIVPGLSLNAPDTLEIPYNEELAFTMADNSVDFQIWITNTAMNSDNYSRIAEKKKEQYENLK